ncbi:hypothetical protein TRVA0_009S01992 [Trichomonascus vanleenenianus]|uniref:uncharacterized protein n=1 Tax=Trichomonascus vanleenenianus TaxID=2268995 RepID=UPI003ECA5A75
MIPELRKKSKSTPKLKLEAVGAAIRLVSHDSDDERGGTSFFRRRSSKRHSGDSFMSKYSDDRDAFIDPESPWTGSFSRKIRESPGLERIQESGDEIDLDAIKARKGSYLSINFGESDSSLDDEEEKYLRQLREFDELRLRLDQEPIYSKSTTNPLVSDSQESCETLSGSASRLVKRKPAPLPLAGVAAAPGSSINTPTLPPSSPPPPTPSEASASITSILRSSSSVPVLRISSTTAATAAVTTSADDTSIITFRNSLHRPSISQSSTLSGMSVSSSILYPPTKLHSDTESMTTTASSILTPTSSNHTSPALSSSPCTFELHKKPGRLLSLPSFAPTHKLEKLQREVNELQDKSRQIKKDLSLLAPIANGNPYKYPREQRQESKKKYDELNHELEIIEKQKYETGIKLTRAWKRYRECNGGGTEFWAHGPGA